MKFSLSENFSEGEEEKKECDDEAVLEPTHPIGFAKLSSPWGKTWFSLEKDDAPRYIEEYGNRTTYGLDEDDDSVNDNNSFIQSCPPLSTYISSNQASTTALLQLNSESSPVNKGQQRQQQQRRHLRQRQRRREADDDLCYSVDEEDFDEDDKYNDDICYDESNDVELLYSRILKQPALYSSPLLMSTDFSKPSKFNLQQRGDLERDIQRRIDAERQKIDDECRQNDETLAELILENEREADTIRKKQEARMERFRKEERAKEERNRVIREKAEHSAMLKKAKEEKELSQKHEAERRKKEAKDADDRQREEEHVKATKEVEYIERAKKLVANLLQVRSSVEPFEKSKAAGKRRLGMKKIARGKVNTLNDNPEKIRQVATDITQAIATYEAEDLDIKQKIQKNEPNLTKEMTVGRRYFVDLLCSTIMTRIQAESFGGVQGNGFPLAAMLSLISVQSKQFIHVFTAHMFTVCPTCIPVLPSPPKDASEDEVMTSLGMQRDKKSGEYETFTQFLARTENIISFMAEVQSSLPENHTVLGGSEGAMKWLDRFLCLLPPPPASPLPLITATILGAFLTGAGHMLAKRYPGNFKKALVTIENDIMKRLDEGEMGKPSLIRLEKVIEGGFDRFVKNLPKKAIPECYCGATEDSQKNEANIASFGGEIGGVEEKIVPKRSQQQQTNHGTSNNPFSGGIMDGTSQQKQMNTNTNNNPFGGASVGVNSFTGSMLAGTFDNQQNVIGSDISTAYGSSAVSSASPFRGGNNGSPVASPSPFGTNQQQSGSFTAGNSFGGPRPSPSPFGAQSAQSGNFGAAGSKGLFGASTIPFAGTTANGSATGNPSPFGIGNSAQSQAQHSFGQGGNFGAQNASPFGASSPSPFGGQPKQQGGGGFGSATPFRNMSSPSTNISPFGATSSASNNMSFSNNSFGGRGGFGSNSNTGGCAVKKLPCKFFAQGKCRFGSSCKFSHELDGNQGFQSNQSFNQQNFNSFGGRRR